MFLFHFQDFPNQRHMRNEKYEEYENMKLVFGGMRRLARSHSQPCEVRKNEILKQEVDLTNDDDEDDEVHEIRETETDALVEFSQGCPDYLDYQNI
ncbi:hypothetical protein YC2023_011289 [Brassica napus]